MDLFDNIFREIKSHRKVLQVALYLLNGKRYDDCKLMLEKFLTKEEVEEPINDVLNTEQESAQIEE